MNSVSSNAVYNATKMISASSSNANWYLQEFSNGIIIGYCFNNSTLTLGGGEHFYGYAPSGYVVDNIISADAFASSNTAFVRGASHVGGSGDGVVVYVQVGGTFYAGYFRVVALLHKSS